MVGLVVGQTISGARTFSTDRLVAMTLGASIARLAVECVVVAGVLAGVMWARRSRRMPVEPAIALALGGMALVVALGHLHGIASLLNQARRHSVSSRAALDHCFVEDGAQKEAPFIDWVHGQLPVGAVYTIADGEHEPDGWCLTLALLPALPEGPGHERAGWEIDFGEIPPAVDRLQATSPSSVRAFAPGFALARLTPR